MKAAHTVVERKVMDLARDLGADGYTVYTNSFGGFDVERPLFLPPSRVRIWVEDSGADTIRLEVLSPVDVNLASASFTNQPLPMILAFILAWLRS